ncbi:MAG: hypothetical protein ACYDEN_06570, partial [Acidimicrobiales bacterium]
MTPADLLAPLRGSGGRGYLGEPVTQLEHACQAAALAAGAGAPDTLVVAALFHDVGWLLPAAGRGAGAAGARAARARAPGDPEATDANHAGRGATWLLVAGLP